MTKAQATKSLSSLTRAGYVAYHTGLIYHDDNKTWGVNVDGDGHDGRLFGCPKTFWSIEKVEEFLINIEAA